MELVHDILLFLHFLGLAALFGGLFTQLRATERVVNPAVLHGVLTQLVTGVLLVGVNEMDDADVDHAKVGVKLLVALVIGVLAVARRKQPLSGAVFGTMLALTALNVGVAVFWG
ncbi:hypothetical protein [Nocardioides caldifontis]|uniref:hypothetical protein n=1 Tax=Nocardioides caldifontis TaxID=2588938 RepID=UPI0011DF3576|nr:hypothetical protein [Nocardioides caldifontis]